MVKGFWPKPLPHVRAPETVTLIPEELLSRERKRAGAFLSSRIIAFPGRKYFGQCVSFNIHGPLEALCERFQLFRFSALFGSGYAGLGKEYEICGSDRKDGERRLLGLCSRPSWVRRGGAYAGWSEGTRRRWRAVSFRGFGAKWFGRSRTKNVDRFCRGFARVCFALRYPPQPRSWAEGVGTVAAGPPGSRRRVRPDVRFRQSTGAEENSGPAGGVPSIGILGV